MKAAVKKVEGEKKSSVAIVEGSISTTGVSNTGEYVFSSLDCCTDLFANSLYINHRFILQ
jgi:Mn-containing catalase